MRQSAMRKVSLLSVRSNFRLAPWLSTLTSNYLTGMKRNKLKKSTSRGLDELIELCKTSHTIVCKTTRLRPSVEISISSHSNYPRKPWDMCGLLVKCGLTLIYEAFNLTLFILKNRRVKDR